MNPNSIAIIQNRIDDLRMLKGKLIDDWESTVSDEDNRALGEKYHDIFLRERELSWVLGVLQS
jgi:hypothetical protein